ncbi:hypothetical protein TcasGA2_TC007196 [Tribolium castaneum]|uniref:Uncharacterized protein n=1 Tax=Tribolium castaneum TaxID=7070 RepID=D2A0V9_TRICA|nr:hypothetical protein TcasGA2_TC007196 [Tribolium castaneum]
MCPKRAEIAYSKNIKNSSDTKTSGNMLVCVKKASNIPSYFKRATLKIALVEGRSKLIRLMTCAFNLPLIHFMQVDVRRANDLIPQGRYLLYRLEQSIRGWKCLNIIRSLNSVDLTRYIWVLSNFKPFLFLVKEIKYLSICAGVFSDWILRKSSVMRQFANLASCQLVGHVKFNILVAWQRHCRGSKWKAGG